MRLSNRLKELRLAREITLREFALRSRVNLVMISAIERWGYSPPLHVCRRIAAALDVPIDEIWLEELPPQSPDKGVGLPVIYDRDSGLCLFDADGAELLDGTHSITVSDALMFLYSTIRES